jgi:hypothetical protein
MKQCPSRKKLLAYEKEVKTARYALKRCLLCYVMSPNREVALVRPEILSKVLSQGSFWSL